MPDAPHEALRGFPVIIEIPVAWGEMDAFQHVNNIVYFRYFESVRIAYFDRLAYFDATAQTGLGPILASITCRFRFPLTYPDVVWAGAKITELGQDRFTMRHIVVSQRHGRVAAEGDGVIVSFNYRAQRKATLPDDLRRRIEALEQRDSSFTL